MTKVTTRIIESAGERKPGKYYVTFTHLIELNQYNVSVYYMIGHEKRSCVYQKTYVKRGYAKQRYDWLVRRYIKP
jgi:hypothetical protein